MTAASRFGYTPLRGFASTLLETAGMGADDAHLLADSLVAADATGVSTHGLVRLEPYCAQLASGQVAARPHEVTVSEGPGSLLVDADRGFGAPVGVRVVDRLVDKAAATGVAVGGVRRVAHFGAAGYYTRRAAERGCVAMAMSSSSASVVPYGGRGPRIGNSPMSFAAPGRGGPELVLDMAQATTSRGRIKLLADEGAALPEGWAVDADGRPTTDPVTALAGAVLPSGGHKGSALALMVEMLASALTGATLTQHIQHAGFTAAGGTSAATDVTVGNLYLVIDADVFGDAAGVRERTDLVVDHVRASAPAPGVDRVRAPGDVEAEHLARARDHGVAIGDRTLAGLEQLAARLGAPAPPDALGDEPDPKDVTA